LWEVEAISGNLRAMPDSNLASRHLMSVKGVPKTVQILHIVAAIGFFIPGICLVPALFILPVLLLLGQISVTWQDLLFSLLTALGIGILFIVHTEMQEVIDAYSVLDDIRSELDAKNCDTLTIAERNVLTFYRHGTILRL
jgi:hypothetical protein